MWQDPRAYAGPPPMIFFMYYLTDTTPQNACLRYIPSSHRKRHLLHDLVPKGHTEESWSMAKPDSPQFQTYPDEIDVPVRAGNVVVGDARGFHSSHPNNSDAERTVITIWYHPFFSDLTEPTQAWLAQHARELHKDWPREAFVQVESILARYEGDSPPMPDPFQHREMCTPGPDFK